MDYKTKVNTIRDNAEFTAHAISDGVSLLLLAVVGIVSAFPESVALYLSSADRIPYGASVGLSVALPSVSVAAVYLAVTFGGFNRFWFLFVAQLGLSAWVTLQLGATWEVSLIGITGIGAWIASASYNVSRETRKEDITQSFKLSEESKDNEVKRQIKLMREQDKLNRTKTPDKRGGHGDKKQRAYQLISEGLSQSEIASELGVSDRTVRRWLSGSMSANVHVNGVHSE